MTITLSVSGDMLGDCSRVVALLKRLNVNGDVTRNQTVLDGIEEPGCRIRLFGEKAKARLVWEALQKEMDLTCGHIDIATRESGCVLDVLRPSLCPGAQPTNVDTS